MTNTTLTTTELTQLLSFTLGQLERMTALARSLAAQKQQAEAIARTCQAECDRAEAELAQLRPEVRAFAGLMEAKLRENDHKPGWKHDDPYALFRRLCEEVGELRAALKKPFAVAGETADVANFAMMIADVCGWLITEYPVSETADKYDAMKASAE